MTKEEIREYIKNTLSRDEKTSVSVAMRCPNCSAKGCEFCKDGWIRPIEFLKGE